MKKITIIIHSTDIKSAEGYMPQITTALARGDEAMAALVPRERYTDPIVDGVKTKHVSIERVEYWSEDVPDVPLGPPTWGRKASADGNVDASTRVFEKRSGDAAGSEGSDTPLGIECSARNMPVTAFNESVGAIRALGLDRQFEWQTLDTMVYVVAKTERARRLLPLL